MLCSFPAQAVYGQLLVGVFASQVPGLAEVGVGGLAEKMCKPVEEVRKALDELVVANLAEVDAEASLIRLPGVPEDHAHVAASTNNVIGWMKIVKELARQDPGRQSDLLRRHVDEILAVIRDAVAEHGADGPGGARLQDAIRQLESFGSPPNPLRSPSEPPSEPHPKPLRSTDTEPETDTNTDTEPDTARERAADRLLNTLVVVHPKTVDSSERWKPKNRLHIAAAEALLAQDSDPGWPDEVIGIVTDFAVLCGESRKEAKFWRAPRMLSLIPAPKSESGKSAWETIKSVVATWRAEQRVKDEEARERHQRELALERKRVSDRMADLEDLARNGEPGFNRILRESGQKALPSIDHKACLSAAQEAIADARRDGRDPTLEEIERAVREAQKASTCSPPS